MKVSMAAMRVNARLKQSEASKCLKVSTKTLQSWESGKTLPNLSQFEAMCRLYGCTKDDIFIPEKLA